MTRTYYFDAHKRLKITILTLLALWLGWMISTLFFSRRTYLEDGAPDTLVIITVASAAGLFVAWRQLMRGSLSAGDPFTLFKTFFSTVLMVTLTLWQTPETWVRLTATEKASREVSFSLEHPGPSTSRFSSCKTGMRFYDDELRRSMFFCVQESNVPPGSRKVEVEKLMNAHGARYLRYRYLLADNTRSPWQAF